MATRQKINKVIFDTGPLLIALALNYVNETNYCNAKILLNRAYDKFDNIGLNISEWIDFFENFQTIYTSPHSIGEVIGLVNSRMRELIDINLFWDISIKYLSRKGLKEELISIIDLYNSKEVATLIPKIGFVDSELIKLSMSLRVPILSIDKRTLGKEAEKKLVNVIIIQDDIYDYLIRS